MEKELLVTTPLSTIDSFRDLLEELDPMPSSKKAVEGSTRKNLSVALNLKRGMFAADVKRCFLLVSRFFLKQKSIAVPVVTVGLLYKAHHLEQEISQAENYFNEAYKKAQHYNALIDSDELKRIYLINLAKLEGAIKSDYEAAYTRLEEVIKNSNIWRHLQNADRQKQTFDEKCRNLSNLNTVNEKMHFYVYVINELISKTIELNHIIIGLSSWVLDLSIIETRGKFEGYKMMRNAN